MLMPPSSTVLDGHGEDGQALSQWNSDLGGSRCGVPPSHSMDSEDTKRGNTGLDLPFSPFLPVLGDDPRTDANQRRWHARWDVFRLFDPNKSLHNLTAEQRRAGQIQFSPPRRGFRISQGSLCPYESKGCKNRRDSSDGSDESQVQSSATARAGKGHKNKGLSLDADAGRGCHAGCDAQGEMHELENAQLRPLLLDKGKSCHDGSDSSYKGMGRKQVLESSYSLEEAQFQPMEPCSTYSGLLHNRTSRLPHVHTNGASQVS